jgi:oligo-1,6-glucosidase
MTNAQFDNIDSYDDIMTRNWYKLTKAENGDLDKFIASHKLSGRDNARTPIHWDDKDNAGFTTGTPWLPVNANHIEINVAEQEKRSDSPLNYFRRLTKMRKENLVFVYGEYELLLPDHEKLFAYLRTINEQKVLVLLNYSSDSVSQLFPSELVAHDTLINNYDSLAVEDNTYTLLPWQAVVINVS